MKMNEIIRERRLAKHFTQEQIANYLGVTAPAVNKWEKGTSYPDITILPALARLLGTDLNTLLSFKEELTKKEITLFLEHLHDIAENEGFEAVYAAAMEKVKEYPTCYLLLLNVALLLDGVIFLYGEYEPGSMHRADIEALYRRVLKSPDNDLRNQARSMLISRYLEREEYDQAQELIDLLPEKTFADKKQFQANLYSACGKLDEAAAIEEEKLLSAANEIQGVLMTLMEIAIKENRIEDAKYIADVSKEGARLFGLWEYSSCAAHFQLYCALKDREKSFEALVPMLGALDEGWDISKSPLYRHMKKKDVEKGMGAKMKSTVIQLLQEDESTAFLRESGELQRFVEEAGL